MPYLPLNALLRPQSTPEEQNFLDQFYTKFDSGSAAHKKILNVEPLFFMGLIAGSEFLVYSTNTLYLAYNLKFNRAIGQIADISGGQVNFYDENNVLTGYFLNVSALAGAYSYNLFEIKNIYLSRIALVNTSYTNMYFNGYRITLN